MITLLFFYRDSTGSTFRGSLSHYRFKVLGDFVKLDDGKEFVLIIFENFGTQFIAVSVSHTHI
jgi:hypothetical protein